MDFNSLLRKMPFGIIQGVPINIGIQGVPINIGIQGVPITIRIQRQLQYRL